jgi:hypothetical protein
MTIDKTDQTEAEVIQGLTEDGRFLLQRVLEIERSRLHLLGSDVTIVDDLHLAVKGIVG